MENITDQMLKETKAMKKETKQEDVERLREWLLRQPHHPEVVEDEILSAFVHGTKSLEIAKQKLESFFTWRAHLSKTQPFFNIRDPSDSYYKQCTSVGNLFFLPKTTSMGYKVLFTGMKDLYDKNFDFDHTVAHFLITFELSLALWPDMNGIFMVWDMKGLTPKRAAMMNLSTLETTMRYFQDSIPVKMKGIVFLNAPPIMETVYNTTLKLFLKEKLKKRIIITKEDSRCLKRYLPEEILPLDYGGKEKHSSELNDDWLALIEEKKDWLKNNLLLVADESKRPPLHTKRNFGLEGTFRTLAID